MNKVLVLLLALLCLTAQARKKKEVQPMFPDGVTPIAAWFSDTAKVDVATLGRQYVLTDYGVRQDSTIVQTRQIQAVIDRCASEGGGVVVVPQGTFLTGALFFKPGTHLHFQDGGRLKGIDDIRHYPLVPMHMEGQQLDYFAALVNADGVDGFTITGHGTIDGNAQRFWDEFWLRRKWNKQCTNLEALRPQLVYISHSDDVTVQDVRLINSAFWTNHLYRCDRVKYLDCYIVSPTEGKTHAPSSDGIDLDDCDDVLVRGCYISVWDDGVCLKGGKGTWVDRDSTAGPVNRVIVERCTFGPEVVGGITFGSEAYDCHNVILRDCHFQNSWHMLLFKMRTDTPQQYGDVLMERCTGTAHVAIEASSWSQFHALGDRPDAPISTVNNVTIRNLQGVKVGRFFNVNHRHPFKLSNFTFSDIDATDKQSTFHVKEIDGLTIQNVTLNGKPVAQFAPRKSVPVYITAGQSNADGRVPMDELPAYIQQNKYQYCQWSYGSGDFLRADGGFSAFWPRLGRTAVGDRWGFDAVVYYLLEQQLQRPFYVIKETVGGTAIDTLCTRSTHGLYWCADADWLSRNRSASQGGKSLAKALTEHIGRSLDSLAARGLDADIRALIWHQGESDKPQADRYYDNLRTLVGYVRQYLVSRTGRTAYARLPIVCGTYNRKSRDYSPVIVSALHRLAAEDPDFHVVDASDLSVQRDNLHFDARGAEQLGRRVYEQLTTSY